MKIVASIWDIHYPTHHQPTIEIFKQVIKDIKPTHIVWGGDEVNCDGISKYTAKTVANGIEDAKMELEGFKKEIFDPISKTKAKMYHLGGNHDDQRIRDLLRKLDEKGEYGLKKYAQDVLDLNKYFPGCEMHQYNDFAKIGKVHFTHGEFHNDAHAKKHALTWGVNLIYGHLHSTQLYTHIAKTNEPHQAISMPCACQLNPDYMKNKSSKWLNGFGITYIDDKGNFWHYPVHVINNKAIFNGKTYKA